MSKELVDKEFIEITPEVAADFHSALSSRGFRATKFIDHGLPNVVYEGTASSSRVTIKEVNVKIGGTLKVSEHEHLFQIVRE